MTLGMFSVYDCKSNEYFQPFYAKNYETAKRNLISSFDADSLFVHYPSDYSLWFIAEFDTETGEINYEFTAREHLDEIRDLIPESFQQFALDGSFKPTKKN